MCDWLSEWQSWDYRKISGNAWSIIGPNDSLRGPHFGSPSGNPLTSRNKSGWWYCIGLISERNKTFHRRRWRLRKACLSKWAGGIYGGQGFHTEAEAFGHVQLGGAVHVHFLLQNVLPRLVRHIPRRRGHQQPACVTGSGTGTRKMMFLQTKTGGDASPKSQRSDRQRRFSGAHFHRGKYFL